VVWSLVDEVHFKSISRQVLPMPEFRIDPADGQAYTLAQVQSASAGTYTQDEVATYWTGMVPVKGGKTRPRPQITEADIEKVRGLLRYGLNDRVICNCGRWLPGHIVGTAVVSDGTILPYLVKTDMFPGLPSNTISVPMDNDDDVCIQEVCFDPREQLWLIQAAAALVHDAKKPKLRFAAGDKICCRVQNIPNDKLEQWVSGEVRAIWPKPFGDLDQSWDMGEVSGEFPDTVPYHVIDTSGRHIYCHRDDYTLIRREGFQPFTRVRGVSKRIENVKAKDGSKEKLDHVTERRVSCVNELSDSD